MKQWYVKHVVDLTVSAVDCDRLWQVISALHHSHTQTVRWWGAGRVCIELVTVG